MTASTTLAVGEDTASIAMPSPRRLAFMLALLAMLGPFAIDAYLPAFTGIGDDLHASAFEVQQTLTAFIFAVGVMALWHGGLSDAYGRRRIILASLAVFAAASLGCAIAGNVSYLWVFRVVQGLSAGAGMVVGRAIIRDRYSGADATRLLTMVTMFISLAPATAPIIGGWFSHWMGWRSIFIFMLLYSAALMYYCYRNLPETLAPQERLPFRPQQLMQRYALIFSTPLFHLKGAAVAFSFVGFFLYVAAAPVFLGQHLGLRPDQFFWQFSLTVSGIFTGAFAVNKLTEKWPVTVLVMVGFVLIILAGLINVIYHSLYPPAFPWSIAPLFIYTVGLALLSPGTTLMVLDLFPTMRGTVASCQSFTLKMLTAIVAGVVAPLLSRSALWLALGQLTFALISLLSWRLARSDRMQQTRPDTEIWEVEEENLT